MKHKFFLLTMLFTGSLCAGMDCINFESRVSVLFLQPNSSNLYYGAEATPLPLPSPNWKSLEITPDFHTGFDIEAKALFNGTNSGLSLSWERLHSCDSASTSVAEADMLGPYFNIGPDAHPYINAYGHAKHEFDAVNLYYVGELASSNCLKANYFAGVALARVKQTVSSYFSNDDETVTRFIKSPSEFNGAGPEFGVDFNYNFCRSFSFLGEATVGFLTGSLKNKTKYLSVFPLDEEFDITPPNTQKTSVPSRTQVVPSLGGKLGLSYKMCYNACVFTLDFGYLAKVYINAIQSVDMISEVDVPPFAASEIGVFALGFRRTVSNFVLAGPYVTLNVQF